MHKSHVCLKGSPTHANFKKTFKQIFFTFSGTMGMYLFMSYPLCAGALVKSLLLSPEFLIQCSKCSSRHLAHITVDIAYNMQF